MRSIASSIWFLSKSSFNICTLSFSGRFRYASLLCLYHKINRFRFLFNLNDILCNFNHLCYPDFRFRAIFHSFLELLKIKTVKMLIFQEGRQFLWFFYTIYSISCSLFFCQSGCNYYLFIFITLFGHCNP